MITADKDQPARKVSRGEITLQLRSTNQRKWLAVETPEERGLRLECYSTRCRVQQPMLPHNSHSFNSVPFKAKMSYKHGYIGDAKMLYLFRNISWLSFNQSLMNVCVLIWRVMIGASLSEPHTSELNGGFFIYYIYIFIYLPYVRRSVNAG